MHFARVIGNATATVKHSSLERWRLMLVQPLLADGGDDGDPVLAVDRLGARMGDNVVATSDGNAVRELMDSNNTPVRWMVIGIVDE